MKHKLRKIHNWIAKFIKLFNIGFFVISTAVWVVLSVQTIATQPFEFGLLWTAFNQMYAQYSFKLACIFVIIFNGLSSLQQIFQNYMDVTGHVENSGWLRRMWTKIKN